MTDFKFGDRVRIVGSDEDLTFIGKTGDTVYATREIVGGEYVVRFSSEAYTGYSWKAAPKPFFEAQKTYVYENGEYRWTVHHVIEMGNKRFAAGLDSDGDAFLLSERDFRLMIEVL